VENLTFTPEQLEEALTANKFWLDGNDEAAKVVHEATKAGFVFRGSHTQAHWTKAGIDWYYASLNKVEFEAQEDTQILYVASLGGGVSGRTVKKGEKIRFLGVTNDLGRESVSTYETLHRIDKHYFFSAFKQASHTMPAKIAFLKQHAKNLRENGNLKEADEVDNHIYDLEAYK